MIHQILRLRTLVPVLLQHGEQEFAERLGRFRGPCVLLNHDPLQWPRLQIPNAPEMALGVEQLPAVLSPHLKTYVKVAKELEN